MKWRYTVHGTRYAATAMIPPTNVQMGNLPAAREVRSRRIEWTVGGKEREPLHSTVRQNAA
jgi:hypothetical protein